MNITLPSPVSLESIPHLWQQSDVLIFLIDLDNYAMFSTSYLNRIELESFEKLQTNYFKKRYIISRTILKHILCNITKERSIFGIFTYKDRYGKVCILNHKELYICISYTENLAALAISKVEVGIDIEILRKMVLKSNLKNMSIKPSLRDETEIGTDFLKVWTLKEAYSKFSNKSMHLIFNEELDLSGVSHSTYFLDKKYIFSVVTHSDSHIIDINSLQKIDCNWD